MMNPSIAAHEQNPEAERALIADVLAGKHERFYELIAPLERRIYFTAYEILRSQQEAEDAAQEAILNAFRHLSQFRGEARFSTWLISITINQARQHLRRNREVSLDTLSPEENDGAEYTPIELADWRDIPGDALERENMARHVTEAVASLPEIYREVLVLRDMNGMSIAETAEALGLSSANVKVRLLRARLMLRDAFVSANFTHAASHRGWKSLMIQLSCDDVRQEISNYIEGDIPPRRRQMIDAHLEQCKRCAVLMDSVHNMIILIADDRRFSLPPGLTERLHQPLAAEMQVSSATKKKRGADSPRAG